MRGSRKKTTIGLQLTWHNYLTFAGVAIREVHQESIDKPADALTTDLTSMTSGLKEAFDRGITHISKNLPSLLFSPHAPNVLSHTEPYEKTNGKPINFILPLAGRFDTFRRFVSNFETVCLKKQEKVTLLVIIYPSEQENTIQRIVDTTKGLQKQYPKFLIRYVMRWVLRLQRK